MTEMKAIEQDGSPQRILSVTEEHLQRSVEDLNGVIKAIKAGDISRSKEVTAIISLLGKALQSALDERTRVEKLRKSEAGVVNDYALDFDAARDEIGRRLARLRATGSGAELP
jgi:hypothetical protein